MKKQILDSIENLNDNILCVEVSYGEKVSLDDKDTSRKYFEVVRGNEKDEAIPANKRVAPGDLLKFNSRFVTEICWIEAELYNIIDYRMAWFKILKKDVKADSLKRRGK